MIGSNCFQKCALEEIQIPKNCVLNDSAFFGCPLLSSIILSYNVTVMENAFKDCLNLSKIVITQKLKLNFFSFDFCKNITVFYCDIDDIADPGTVYSVHAIAYKVIVSKSYNSPYFCYVRVSTGDFSLCPVHKVRHTIDFFIFKINNFLKYYPLVTC